MVFEFVNPDPTLIILTHILIVLDLFLYYFILFRFPQLGKGLKTK